MFSTSKSTPSHSEQSYKTGTLKILKYLIKSRIEYALLLLAQMCDPDKLCMKVGVCGRKVGMWYGRKVGMWCGRKVGVCGRKVEVCGRKVEVCSRLSLIHI